MLPPIAVEVLYKDVPHARDGHRYIDFYIATVQGNINYFTDKK